ncbi:hypothetical protein ACS0TY_018354 [Phlomoides rotata]
MLAATKPTFIFTYGAGTVKYSFSNHRLLVYGLYHIPFLLNFPDRGHHVFGEICVISPVALARMDELEGLSRGHYERLLIEIELEEKGKVLEVEAYYRHQIYA